MIETQVEAVEKMIRGILAGEPEYFLVEVKIHPTNNIKVFIDGDNGISIEKCVSYNRQLYKMIEGSGLFPSDDFSLELSSPGLDEPLRLLRQFRKNKGRLVEVLLKNGVRIDGVLEEVAEAALTILETKGKKINGRPVGKKVEIVKHILPFEEIKSTKIQIHF